MTMQVTRMDSKLQTTKLASDLSNLKREMDNNNRRVDDLELDLYMLRSKDTGSHRACPRKSSCRNRGRCRRRSPPRSKCRPSCPGSRNRRRWSQGDPGRWPWGYTAQSSTRGGQFRTESPCSWWGTGRKTWTQRSGTVLHFDMAPTGRQSQQSRICHLHV